MKQPGAQTSTWSVRMYRHQPRQRASDSGVMAKTSPRWLNDTEVPPTALGMAPTRLPMPQPLSRTKLL